MNVKPLFSQVYLPPERNCYRICKNRDAEEDKNDRNTHQTRIHKAGFDPGSDELSGGV
jgi:hypothetical protein